MGNRSARCLISLGAIWALLTGVDTAAAGQGGSAGIWLFWAVTNVAAPCPEPSSLPARAAGTCGHLPGGLGVRPRSQDKKLTDRPRSQPGEGQGWDSKKVGAGTKGKQKCSDRLRSPLVGEDKRTMGESQIAR